MIAQRILIVDDEPVLCNSLKIGLEDEGYHVQIANTGEEAMEELPGFDPGVILLDLRLPGMDGIQVLKKIRDLNQGTHTIMITAYGDTQTTVEAIKLGAYDFINKPFELEELKELIRNALEKETLKQEVEYLRYRQQKFDRYGDLVGSSPQMTEVYRQIQILADSDRTTVLIRGETGTGKELVAGEIHFRSSRKKAPFMEINCASLPEHLLESELFGYEKGAFTDAKQLKKGLFELADRGTIFLDEVGEIPVSLQAKLLRFLEKKEFKRLGSGTDIKVDVRIVAATNLNLEEAIKQGGFRQDLFYRLNVVTLCLPPLRQRKDDIVLLANHFLDEFCRDMGKPRMPLSPAASERLLNAPWPGNVRELRNLIERMVIFGREGLLDETPHLPDVPFPAQQGGPGGFNPGDLLRGKSLDDALLTVEGRLIKEVLAQSKGNKTLAAKRLGISRFSLKRRIDKVAKKYSEII
jgi:two-component system response regulator AtoC